MKLKPEMKIEISGHTDSEGDDATNLELSKNRAEAVKQYLISKGINGARVSTIGYGETKPVASNASSDGRAKNRRTEIRIL
jgi:outer membrane protein OmpA-like peptidoglycan-associated protein